MGLASVLARPERRVGVASGAGKLLIKLGARLTMAIITPPNLAIVCVDNGHYGETGYQQSHTSLGVDLEKIAAGAGIQLTRTIEAADDLAAGGRLIREANAAAFVLLRVKPTEPPSFKRVMDPAFCHDRFRAALLGT